MLHHHPSRAGAEDFMSLSFLVNAPPFACIEMVNVIRRTPSRWSHMGTTGAATSFPSASG
ncbi:hypothetical protein PgNI_06130 [Pyricularia grisea]|uniref:Uncharacterized protein n=1 Tax=Pyricularia grisea TaxID=148305 RepID=A0A6P8B7S2_PYRGI|nr:hypothetical protein PgNI_06130 [Pyricularia grisea]TLD11372.1 hypothetical protein PgNI_06130 [Pyricularia grisea]